MITEEKIAELYRNHGRELYIYLARLLGNTHTADDLLQDCFLKLIEYSNTREVRPETLRAFLYRTAHNLAVNHLKRRTGREETLPDTLERIAERETPQDIHDRTELAEAIGKALAKLDEYSRSLFIMKKELGMETSEIAEIMKVSEKTVRRKLVKTLDFLTMELKNGGYAP